MVKNENELTFEEVFEQNYDMLVKRCKREMGSDAAEDIVCETFIVLYNKWDKLDSHQEKAMTTWLFNALKLKCHEHRRKISKRREDYDCDYEQIIKETPDTSLNSGKEEQKYLEYIDEIRKRLSPTDLSVFECIVVNKMTLGQAAEYLGLTAIATRVRWSRAKEHIRMFIGRIQG